jgi:hypothetical protein
MGRPYSEDLRSRIVAAVDDGSLGREVRGQSDAAVPAYGHGCNLLHAALDVLNQERIRDNLGSHKVAGVRDAIEARGFNRSPL